MLLKSMSMFLGLALSPMVTQVDIEYAQPGSSFGPNPGGAFPGAPGKPMPPGFQGAPPGDFAQPGPSFAPNSGGAFPGTPGKPVPPGFQGAPPSDFVQPGPRFGPNSGGAFPGLDPAPMPPGFQGTTPGAAPAFPGGGKGAPGAPSFPNTAPTPGANPVGPAPGPNPPPAEFHIEIRQPEWREQNFSNAGAAEKANQYADRARELGYEIHLEHYRDRSRVGYRMTEWTVYATVYRAERAQQLRTFLESQGLETRIPEPPRPALQTIPAAPPNAPGPIGPGRFGSPRFSFDSSYGGNGIPQAW